MRSDDEKEAFLALLVTDDELERCAEADFSIGNCTDARTCQAPNDPNTNKPRNGT
jgi:hypothetical protein